MNNHFYAFLIPSLFSVVYFLTLKAKFRIKQWNWLYLAFLLGIFSVVTLLLLDQFAASMEWNLLKSFKRTVFYSFIVIGFGAELGKFLVLRYFFLPKKTFKGPFDAIIYAISIALGYTFLASFLLSLGFLASPVKLDFLLLYPLANLAFAAISGFFVGLGKLRSNRLIDSLTGLGAASFLHGFFYFVNLTDEVTIYVLFMVGSMLIAAILLLKARNLLKEEPTA